MDNLQKIPPCTAPWDTIQVTEVGEVLLCCNGFTMLGYLRDQDILALWNGEEANKYRQGLLSGNYYKVCAHCKKIAPEDKKRYERKNL